MKIVWQLYLGRLYKDAEFFLAAKNVCVTKGVSCVSAGISRWRKVH